MLPSRSVAGRGALFGLVLLGSLAAGCGGGSDGMVPLAAAEDVEGTYSLNLTNSSNECGFEAWEDGKSFSGVSLAVTQDDEEGTSATGAATGGGVQLVLQPLLGSNEFEGKVTGAHVVLDDFGTPAFHKDECTYTIKATIDGRLDGDLLEGTISYAPQTNGSPDCGELNDCASVQTFNGTRPPAG